MMTILTDLNTLSRAMLHVQIALEQGRHEQAHRAALAGEKLLARMINEVVTANKRREVLVQAAFGGS